LDDVVRGKYQISLQEIMIITDRGILAEDKLKVSNGKYIMFFFFPFFFFFFCFFSSVYICMRTWEIACLQFQIRPLQTKNNFVLFFFFCFLLFFPLGILHLYLLQLNLHCTYADIGEGPALFWRGCVQCQLSMYLTLPR